MLPSIPPVLVRLVRIAMFSGCALPLCAQGIYRDLDPLTRSVWTVDAAGGADFADLPEAVQTARSGDVLLVAPGDYTSFELHGKGLTILGDGGVPRILGAPLSVTGLSARQVLVLRSFEVMRTADSGEALLGRLEDNAGTVWIEDCTLLTEGGSVDGLVVEDCASVVLVRVEAECLTSFHPFGPKAQALHAVRSNVHAFGSTFRAFLHINFGTGGDNGATLEDSFLYASECTFEGGQGWRSTCGTFNPCLTMPGPGGTGLDATAAGTPPITMACTFVGGPPGTNGFGCACSTPPFGQPFTGTVVQEDLPAFRYELESPVRTGTSYQLSAQGQPGDFVWSAFAEKLAPGYVPLYFGTQVGDLPVTLVYEGMTDGAGSLVKSVPVPPLPALSGFERLYAQGLFFNPDADAFLASPSVLLVVN